MPIGYVICAVEKNNPTLPEFTFTKLDDEYKELRNNEVSTDIALELFKTPNTTELTEGRDDATVHPIGSSSRNGESLTTSLIQTYDWSNKTVEYDYNSYGLRGDDPDFDAKRKILFLGSSFGVGTGISERDNHTYKLARRLDADYVNLSPANTLAELIEPTMWFIENYKPNLIVMSESRGIHEGEFFAKTMYKILAREEGNDKGIHYGFKRSYKIARQQYVYMFFKLLQTTGIPIVFLFGNRNKGPWVGLKPYVYPGIDFCYMDKAIFTDLARDNHHPGPETMTNVANLLYDFIASKDYFGE